MPKNLNDHIQETVTSLKSRIDALDAELFEYMDRINGPKASGMPPELKAKLIRAYAEEIANRRRIYQNALEEAYKALNIVSSSGSLARRVNF